MQNASFPTQHAFVCVHVATLEQRIEVGGGGEGEQLSGRFPSVIRREEESGGEGGVSNSQCLHIHHLVQVPYLDSPIKRTAKQLVGSPLEGQALQNGTIATVP